MRLISFNFKIVEFNLMSKETLRSKIEEFFNPGPVGAQALDNDGADSNDEQYMRSYFQKKEEVSKAQHDMPKRKIQADIEMDPKYKGKAVSRAQLNMEDSDSDEEGSDLEEAEDEMDEEEGEEELSDESSVLSSEPEVAKMDE